MMVTPEMLLWLAGKMGMPEARIIRGGRESAIVWTAGYSEFNPATDDAQFGRLVVWAAMQGLWLDFGSGSVKVGAYQHINHDSTPDSIRAAAVVAVCRALGWEGT